MALRRRGSGWVRVGACCLVPAGIHWVSAGPEALGLAGMWSSKHRMVAVERTHTASPGPRCGATTPLRTVRPCGVIALASVLFCLLDLVPETAAFLTVAPNGACRPSPAFLLCRTHVAERLHTRLCIGWSRSQSAGGVRLLQAAECRFCTDQLPSGSQPLGRTPLLLDACALASSPADDHGERGAGRKRRATGWKQG